MSMYHSPMVRKIIVEYTTFPLDCIWGAEDERVLVVPHIQGCGITFARWARVYIYD